MYLQEYLPYLPSFHLLSNDLKYLMFFYQTSPTLLPSLSHLHSVFKYAFLLLSHRVHTVLKSPWSLGEVLEKSVNSIFPWKVHKFLCKSLRRPWIFFNFECSGLESVFLLHFGCLRQNMNRRSENLKVIYTKWSMFYQFKTSELTNVEKLVKQIVQALKPY